MISLLITGHSFQHDLYELIRTFLPEEEIVFISSLLEYKPMGYLIESTLLNKGKERFAITKVSKSDDVLCNISLDINDININQYSDSQIVKLMIKNNFQSLFN